MTNRRVRINQWVHWKLERGGDRWSWVDHFWWIHDWTTKITCRIWGHEPTWDQCGRPEHDYCLWCNKSMPYHWSRE